MPHEYSIAIHQHISAKIDALQEELEKTGTDSNRLAADYVRGQLEELQWLRRHLAATSDLKNFSYY